MSKLLLSVIKSATDVSERVDDMFADGKVSFSELIGFVGEIGAVQNIITNGKAAIQDYWNGSNEDRQDAVVYLAQELQLHNLEVDAKLDATFIYLSHIETSLRNSITAIRGIKNTWA